MIVGTGAVVAGRYEILNRIADGGMSIVYRARRTDDGKVVALKVLREQYVADRDFIERFIREARAAQALVHPNIVPVLDSGQDGDVYFIAMEHVDGLDLKWHLRRNGRLEAADAERIARAVCDALEYAHHEGIVHRDIKPQNILLAADGTVKVTDFGIARAMASVTITQTGTVLGSVQYLSPEQARGAPVGRTSDIYALGVVLFEMLTGRLPFESDSPIAIALKHLHEQAPSARALEPTVPRRVEGIILKAMAKRPEDRYQSAQEMAADLAGQTDLWTQALEDEGSTRTFGLAETGQDPPRRRPGLARFAVVVLLGVGVGLWAGWQAVSAYLNVPEVEMPDLIGRTVIQAEQIARQAGLSLEIGERTYSATVAQDIVIAQEQPAGKRVKHGRRVGVTVSLGPQMVTIPDLVQQTVQSAQLALEGLRLRAVLQEANDDVIKPGSVIRQNPPAGGRLPVDSAVTLVISRGPVQIDMPSLVGRPLPDARRMLEERGLVIAHLRTVTSVDQDPGTVVEQAPSAGTKIRPGQAVITVTVTVRPGEEGAPPRAPVITAEPQPTETPAPGEPSPRPTTRPATPAPRAEVTPRPAPSPQGGGVIRRTRLQVVVPEGPQSQQVKIVIIDESGVRTVYQAVHAPGDHIDQTVRTQGYGIIQVYVDNRLVQEVRP